MRINCHSTLLVFVLAMNAFHGCLLCAEDKADDILDAIRLDNPEKVRELLKGDKAVSSSGIVRNGWRLIHFAVNWNSLKSLHFLLEYGVNASVQTDLGVCPLDLVRTKEAEDLLVKFGGKRSGAFVSLLNTSLLLNNFGFKRIIESKAVKINEINPESSETILHECCFRHREKDNRLTLVRWLISNGANVNAKTKMGLTPADYCSNKEVLEIIQEAGGVFGENADVNEALNISYRSGNYTRLSEILKFSGKGKFDKKLLDYFFVGACLSGEKSIAQALLDAGANVNYRDRGGRTALHGCVFADKTEMVEFLIKHGADVGQKDDSGYSVLDYLHSDEMKKILNQAKKSREAASGQESAPAK